MFKKIVLVVVIAFVALLAYAATRPDAYHFERTMAIKAPPETNFPDDQQLSFLGGVVTL